MSYRDLPCRRSCVAAIRPCDLGAPEAVLLPPQKKKEIQMFPNDRHAKYAAGNVGHYMLANKKKEDPSCRRCGPLISPPPRRPTIATRQFTGCVGRGKAGFAVRAPGPRRQGRRRGGPYCRVHGRTGEHAHRCRLGKYRTFLGPPPDAAHRLAAAP